MKRFSIIGVVLMSVVCSGPEIYAVTTRTLTYTDGDQELEGYLALPDLKENEKRPGVLVIHDWTGLQDYTRERTKQLAELGFVAFAADVYGKGIRPRTPAECGVQAGLYRGDRTLFRRRLNLALEVLRNQPHCSRSEVAAIGYCFGGTGVIELARSGADIRGVVSFHGGLDSPSPADGKNIKAKVLICHGADDPHISDEDREAFLRELDEAKVDYQMISYGGAVHSFTRPSAGNDPGTGTAYHESADRRSWRHMQLFLGEIFPSWTIANWANSGD